MNMKYCRYGSTEDAELQSEISDDASTRGTEEQYPPSTRLRAIVSAVFTLAVLFFLAECLNISPMNVDLMRDEESSLIHDTTSENLVLSSTALSSSPSASDDSSSLERFYWRRISGGNTYVGYLEFCNIGNHTFFYRTAQSPNISTNSTIIPCENSTSTVSPVIRIRPRTNYKLILINRSNQPTNLHTHGFHVSGVGIFDDVRIVSTKTVRRIESIQMSYCIYRSHIIYT